MFPLDLGARGSLHDRRQHLHQCRRQSRDPLRHDARSRAGAGGRARRRHVLKGVRKYIKNNTGTDLKQLFIGTEGTLGVVTRAALRIFPAPAEQQVALCALSSFDKVRALLALVAHAARRRTHRLRGDVQRLLPSHATELVKGVAAPLPTNSSLLRPDGILRQRCRAAPRRLEKLLEEALDEAHHHSTRRLQARAPRPRRSGEFAILASNSAARPHPTASASTSASPSTRWSRSPIAIERRGQENRRGCLRDRVRPCRRRQFARQRQNTRRRPTRPRK